MKMKSSFVQEVFLMKVALVVVFLLSAGTVYAEADFVVDNICYKIQKDSKSVSVTSNNEASYSGKIIIPSSVTYNGKRYNVTEIGSLAFYRCSQVTEVVLPSSIKTIGSRSFCSCTSLKSIDIKEGVEVIEASAFEYCPLLAEVVLPKTIKVIGRFAFRQCESLKSIVIPYGVTELDDTFCGCKSLVDITLPNSLTFLRNTFRFCDSLVSITLPESVTSLSYATISTCPSLKNITLGSKVKSIQHSAIIHCKALETITLPNSVETVQDFAFNDCPSLKTVSVSANTSIGKMIFVDCPNAKVVIRGGEKKANASAKASKEYSFNESLGKEISPVELVKYPFGLVSLDSKMLKKDYDYLMEKNHKNLKKEKDHDHYSYGMKSKIDVSCDGKLIYLAAVNFDKLNDQEKNAVRSYWYLFSFDKEQYPQEAFLQYIRAVYKKLQEAGIFTVEQTKLSENGDESSAECQYMDRMVKVIADTDKQTFSIHVTYDPFRF